MKNELGALKSVREYILKGYGLSQMLDKLEMTRDELNDLAIKYPDFGNEVKKRYNITFEEKKKEIVEEKQDIRAKAKSLGIKNWYNKSEKKLEEEIAVLEAME